MNGVGVRDLRSHCHLREVDPYGNSYHDCYDQSVLVSTAGCQLGELAVRGEDERWTD